MLLRVAVALGAAVIATAAGCSDDVPSSECPIGDRSSPMEIVAMHAPFNTTAIDLADGGVVDLQRPIQGGKVFYAGLRARNVDGCNVQLTAAMRDPATMQVIALEQRPVKLIATGDGWGYPDSVFNDLANVPACPNAASTRDIDGASWLLELRLDEPGGRTATITLSIGARCANPDELDECACECDSDYELGSGCPSDTPDAGVD